MVPTISGPTFGSINVQAQFVPFPRVEAAGGSVFALGAAADVEKCFHGHRCVVLILLLCQFFSGTSSWPGLHGLSQTFFDGFGKATIAHHHALLGGSTN